MKIEVNDELMDHLENLARLKFNEEERKIIMDDMRKILEYMELLDEVNVEEVDETYTVVESTNEFREDEVKGFEGMKDIKKNFPRRDGDFVVIPSIHGVKRR